MRGGFFDSFTYTTMNSERKNFGIIKVGTDVVTDAETGHLDKESIRNIVTQIAEVREELGSVCIVTSGAVAAGRAKLNGLLGVSREHESPEDKQLYSAAGQPPLHNTYEEFLSEHDLHAVQVLLTASDYDRPKFRSLYRRALAHPQIIPVVNENDALTDDEIRFSDNDELASRLAVQYNANRLVVLSSVNGVLRNVDDAESRIGVIESGDNEWSDYVRSTGSRNGRGGMIAKCKHLADAASKGVECGIVDGRQRNVILDYVRNVPENRPGTTFLPPRKEA